MKIKLGIVDDHQLFLKSLSLMLNGVPEFQVVIEALNGKDLQSKMGGSQELPDIMLLDVSMPVMNGPDTANWLRDQYPVVKIAALSVSDEDSDIIKMLRAGCCAYFLKDMHPTEFEKALNDVHHRGYYNGDQKNLNYRRLIMSGNQEEPNVTDREKEFLNHAASDDPYRTIAQKMGVSERTVEGYREHMFEKFNVSSRVGLVLEGIRRGYIKL